MNNTYYMANDMELSAFEIDETQVFMFQLKRAKNECRLECTARDYEHYHNENYNYVDHVQEHNGHCDEILAD